MGHAISNPDLAGVAGIWLLTTCSSCLVAISVIGSTSLRVFKALVAAAPVITLSAVPASCLPDIEAK